MNLRAVCHCPHRGFWGLVVLLVRVAIPVGVMGAEPWPAATPESAGLDSTKLENLWRSFQERNTTAFLLIRRDQVVFERYAAGNSRSTPHYTASLAKALVGGLSLMLAID